jgi:cbb3-type cytochrome oxidase subunit 1
VPALSVWSIRAALLYLGTGFTLGGLMLAAPGLQLPQAVIRLRPLHTELLLVGWMVHLAFGVAYWILPRSMKIRSRTRRGWRAMRSAGELR